MPLFLLVSDRILSCSRSNGGGEGTMTLQWFALYGVAIPWLFLVLLVIAILWSGTLVEPDLIPMISVNGDLLVGFTE